MISIVLPVYNGERYIKQSIDSVLQQTFKDWELIIVNDCSTDDTRNIIEHYALKDNRITIINNVQNLKLPNSLNVGFDNAHGEYYTWTSDDNMYKNNALEIMKEYMDYHKEVGMVYCDYTSINEDVILNENVVMQESENLISTNTVGACFLYRKKVADVIGKYDATMFLVEDYEYWFRIYQQFRVIHLKQNLYYYRIHQNSLSGTRHQEIIKQTARMKYKYLSFILSKTDTKVDKFEILDYIVEANLENKKEIEKEFISLYSGYRIHLCIRKIKLFILRIIKCA